MNGAGNTDYDVVIAGGGMIGTTLCLALAPLGLRVAVVEAVARGAPGQPSFDDRSTALSRSSQRTFEAMGLWPEIAAAATPIRSIHVSDRGRFGFSHIEARQQQVEALGYVVINRVLGDVLQQAVQGMQHLDWMCPARISAAATADDRVTVAVESAAGTERLACRLLVAADGARSAVRAMIGISASHTDYEQTAIIGNVVPDKAPDHRAYERFTDLGPLALLPVADNRAAFVWILPPAVAASMLQLPDDEFTANLQEAFGLRLGRFSRVGKRAAYPLALSRANAIVARRSVLVGNAAHGLHPVAAQGFNLGVRDVAALCDCIAGACARQAGTVDPGDWSILEEYADWRKDDHARLVQLTDGIVRLFGSKRPPLRILRDAGMLGLDFIPGMRGIFAKQMMGLSGRLPRLSRGVPLQ